jgi:hypothetical protein
VPEKRKKRWEYQRAEAVWRKAFQGFQVVRCPRLTWTWSVYFINM